MEGVDDVDVGIGGGAPLLKGMTLKVNLIFFI